MESKVFNINNDKFIKFDNNNAVKLNETYSINYQNVLGSGAFGTIYLGYDFRSSKEVAIKMESQKTKNPQLIYESKILKLLQGGSKNIIIKIVGIPTLYHTAVIGDYSIMIIDYLNKNLEELMNETQDKKFTLKTVLMIADQLVKY